MRMPIATAPARGRPLQMPESAPDAQRPGNRGQLRETRRDSTPADTRATPEPPQGAPAAAQGRRCKFPPSLAPPQAWAIAPGLLAPGHAPAAGGPVIVQWHCPLVPDGQQQVTTNIFLSN